MIDSYTFLCDKCHRVVHVTTSNRNARVRAECCGKVLIDFAGRIYQTEHAGIEYMRMIGTRPTPNPKP